MLERIPAAAATRELDPLRNRLRTQPGDLQATLALARGYLDIGRRTSDPRFVSYAQATLSSWLQREDPPASVLVLAATALQSSHRFVEALQLLDRAIAIEPDNSQAWLTRATLLQVQGKFPEARAACRRLLQYADQLTALTCITGVDGLNGRLQASYDALLRFFTSYAQTDATTRGWVLGQLGEMAVRLGNLPAAELHFEQSLQATPDDVYVSGAYADLLLAQGREREVISLLKGRESHDVLLLRLAIAGKRLGASEGAEWEQLYDARRRAARVDDNPHLREHARFLLEVRDQPEQALQLAMKNWQVQREPADVRIYLQAANLSKQPQAVAAIQTWSRETGYEDRMLNAAGLHR